MSRGRRVLAITFLLVLSPLSCVLATDSLTVVINEIAWMGTEVSWYYEWIELYNSTDQEITISGWKIGNGGEKNETLEIVAGEISPRGYFLICKKEMAKCDFTTWNLSLHNDYNQNGKLILKNEAGIILDQTPELSVSQWPAGNKESYKTMERKDPLVSGNDLGNWQTSQEPGGTPKAENSLIEIESAGETEPASTEATATEEVTVPEPEPIVYPSNLLFNEILPSPEGPDIENEWIEIFNENNLEVDVSGWQISYTIGTTRTYIFPAGTKIGPTEFLVLPRPQTGIILRNDGDILKLLNPNNEIIHQVNYEKAPNPPKEPEQSFNRTSSGWAWSTTLTPGKANIITQPLATEGKEKKLVKEAKEKESGEVKPSPEKLPLAKISGELPEKSSTSLVIFLTAMGIAVASAVIVLILKKRLIGEELETKDRG